MCFLCAATLLSPPSVRSSSSSSSCSPRRQLPRLSSPLCCFVCAWPGNLAAVAVLYSQGADVGVSLLTFCSYRSGSGPCDPRLPPPTKPNKEPQGSTTKWGQYKDKNRGEKNICRQLVMDFRLASLQPELLPRNVALTGV